MDADATAFGRDLVAAAPQLMARARRLTGGPQDAGDLVQETLARAWRFRDRFAAGTNLGAWLNCILRNQHLLGVRRRRMEARYWSRTPEPEFISRPSQEPSAMLHDLARAVQALPEAMGLALIRVAAEGDSYDEAAVRLGTTSGTVKSRVCRARRRLQAQFQAH